MKKFFLTSLFLGAACFLQAQKLGTLDSSFASNGIKTFDPQNLGKDEMTMNSVAGNQGDVYLTGYVTGSNYDLIVSHVLSSGALDPNFGNNGVFLSDFTLGANEVATDICRNVDGSLFITGFCTGGINTDVFVIKLKATGTLDNTFGASGIARINLGFDAFAQQIAIRPDGKIAVGGNMNAGNGSDFFVLVLNADGSKLVSFGDQGLVMVGFGTNGELLTSLLVDANNNMYLGGNSSGNSTSVAIAKVQATGNLDNVFGTSGRFTYAEGVYNTYLNNMKFDALGNIVGVGYVKGGINEDIMVVRITKDGDFDKSFDTDGKRVFGLKVGNPADERLYGMAVQNDGKIVACGTYLDNGAKSTFYIRFQSNGKSDAGFGGAYGYNLIPNSAIQSGYLNNVNIVSNERALIVGRAKNASYDAVVLAVHLTEPFPASVEPVQMHDLSIYPNPTQGTFRIEASNEHVEYNLMSLTGQVLCVWPKGTSNFMVPASLSPGVYFLSGQDGNHIYRTKLIIQ